jgi:imidazolonepropionase-like amidohydrolase
MRSLAHCAVGAEVILNFCLRSSFMRCPLRLLPAVLCLLSGLAYGAPLALTHITIIDATGRAPIENGVIVMDKGRITAVGGAGTVMIPRGAKVLDKTGKYVIPGLMNANVHLCTNLDLDTLIRFHSRYADIIVEGTQVALKAGQTTLFDTWGCYPELKAARARINSGKDVGARLFIAGNIIGFSGPIASDFWEIYKPLFPKNFVDNLNERWTQGVGPELLWDTPNEVGQKVARYAARDVDFLKYLANGHIKIPLTEFSQRSQDAIVRAGHEAGKVVQAHVQSMEGIKAAMIAGVDILTHCDMTPERTTPPEIIKMMVEKGVYCSVQPSSKAFRAAEGEDGTTAHSMINIKNMIAAGVPLMLSTDGAIAHPIRRTAGPAPVDDRGSLAEGHFAALRGLEEIGIDPLTILQIATINVARGYKMDKNLGTLEEGKYADMLVLNGNPFIAARNYEAIDTVIKAGEVIDLSKLPSAPVISNQKLLPED